MIKLTTIILILFLFVFTNKSWSQENSKNLKTSYAFTIENISDVDQLGKIKSEIENLNFVEKVKINTKGEQPTKAQIIVYINEPKELLKDKLCLTGTQTGYEFIILKDNINLLDLQIDSY